MPLRISLAEVRIVRRMARLLRDSRGAAAVEFVLIAPLMLVMFFGVVEVASGVAVDRKVTLVARTLSDLTSQATSVSNADLTGIFSASSAILMPYYTATNLKAKISQVKIDSTGKATISWSVGSNDTAHGCSDTITLPTALKVANTNLIWSEVTYVYTPAVGHTMAGGFAPPSFNLSDSFYTRPRQSSQVTNSSVTACP